MRYYMGSRSMTLGKIEQSIITTSWAFTEERPLIGVFGDSSKGKINKIGFVSLDMQCQNGFDIDDTSPDSPIHFRPDPLDDPIGSGNNHSQNGITFFEDLEEN